MNTAEATNNAYDFEQLTLISDADARQREHGKARAATLRESVLRENSFDRLSDTEKLATILSFARGAADPFTTAENLLDRFGSLKGVIEARPEQLEGVDGLNGARSNMLQLIVPIFRMYQAAMMAEPNRIGNSREAENFCQSLLAGERLEKFYVVALNAQCKVLGKRQIATGSLSEVSAYPRLVMETALNYNAHSVLLSHNHPGGTCAPSPEDISSTLQLQRLLNGVGILVLDHIIVAGERSYSMIQHGDIDYRMKTR